MKLFLPLSTDYVQRTLDDVVVDWRARLSQEKNVSSDLLISPGDFRWAMKTE